jgi:2'-5' RNA ligase
MCLGVPCVLLNEVFQRFPDLRPLRSDDSHCWQASNGLALTRRNANAIARWMRLFVALDIDDPIRERIAKFVEGVQGFAPDGRWVKADSLHVTLKFIGEQPEAQVEKIRQSLASLRSGGMQISFREYGFFPTAKSARVFWIGIEAGPELPALAAAIDGRTAALGIAKEERAYSPHLTLARGPGSSGAPRRQRHDRPNRVFERLQEKLAGLPTPEFGTMTAREFFLYQSQLSPKGAKYTKLAHFDLGSSQ